LNLLLLTLKEF